MHIFGHPYQVQIHILLNLESEPTLILNLFDEDGKNTTPRLNTLFVYFIVCIFMYNSLLVCVLIPYVGCYRCLPSGSQVSSMVSFATLVIWLHLHGSFTRPQDSQSPLEVLAQVLLPIMWPNTELSLRFYGMLCHVVSVSWKSDLTLRWWFPSLIQLIRCKTLFYYVSLCKLGYWKEILSLLHSITFQEIKIH